MTEHAPAYVPDLPDEAGSELTTAERSRVLSGRSRRAALSALTDASMPVPLEALATTLGSEMDDVDRDRFATELHHRHLPLLDRAGLVEYEPGTNTVQSCHRCASELLD